MEELHDLTDGRTGHTHPQGLAGPSVGTWQTLEDLGVALVQCRQHLAGGLELRAATCGPNPGWYVQLSGNAGDTLRAVLQGQPGDEAAVIAWLRGRGYTVYKVREPSAPETLSPPMPTESIHVRFEKAGEVAPPPETILERAIAYWEAKHHAPLTHDAALLLRSDLARHGFQPNWYYAPQAAQCERLMPEWFAEEEEL